MRDEHEAARQALDTGYLYGDGVLRELHFARVTAALGDAYVEGRDSAAEILEGEADRLAHAAAEHPGYPHDPEPDAFYYAATKLREQAKLIRVGIRRIDPPTHRKAKT